MNTQRDPVPAHTKLRLFHYLPVATHHDQLDTFALCVRNPTNDLGRSFDRDQTTVLHGMSLVGFENSIEAIDKQQMILAQ